MSERQPSTMALVTNTLAFAICFASWVASAVLMTYFISTRTHALDASQAGWLLVLPALMGVLSQLPLRFLLERYGARHVFTGLMLVVAATLYLLSLAQNQMQFFLGILAFGVASGSLTVGVGYVSSWIEQEHPGKGLRIFGIGSASAAMTMLLAAYLLRSLTQPESGIEVWHLLPQTYAVLMLVTAIAFWLSPQSRIVATGAQPTLAGHDIASALAQSLDVPQPELTPSELTETSRSQPRPLLPRSETKAVEEILRSTPIFSGLNEAQIKEVVRGGKRQTVGANEVVYSEGDLGEAFYVLIEGSVKIYRTDKQGHETRLETLAEGDFFGELALIDGEPRSTGATTISPCHFFIISRRGFLNIVSKSPRVLTSLLIGLSTRIGRGFLHRFEMTLEKEKLHAQLETERHLSIAQMVAGVAHELNTPLGIVNHAASVLTDALSSEIVQSLVEDDRIKHIVTDIMDASTLIQSNVARADQLLQTFRGLSVRQIAEHKEELDIGTLTEEVADIYRLHSQGSTLDIDIVDELGDLDRRWEGYPGHYSQVIIHLIGNIDRYAYRGIEGGKARIVVSQDKEAGPEPHFSVVVEDFGCGISTEELAKVFEAFYTTDRSQGAGLGLAIVRNVVTSSLHGTVHIDSTPGEGTRVVLSLPQIIQDDQAPVNPDQAPAGVVA